jgi:PPM family protein phosphatase
MAADVRACPACGAGVPPDARYCEACGHDLARPAVAGADPPSAVETAPVAEPTTEPAITSGTSSPPPPGCPSCGHPTVDADGFCDSCGNRRPATADHSEVDLGDLAGVSDIGSRHHHNEDAMGMASAGRATAGVVCDGVSSSSRPDTASMAAAMAATGVFAAALVSLVPNPAVAPTMELSPVGAPDDPATPTVETDDADIENTAEHGTHEVTRDGVVAVLHDAAAAAQDAAARAGASDSSPNPPSTTFVAAVVTDTEVTVGWIGDSRVYWVPDAGTPGGPACLTVDDTLAGQLGAAGVAVASDSPNAGALIRWLGADAADTEPHINAMAPRGPGRVIVCSDGLYRYVPEPAQLAAATPGGSPIDVASALVRLALAAGGQDNVSVVVLPYPPR